MNRCGGLPTHLPAQWPQIDGEDLSFLFQIYCDGKMLDIPNTLCIQGYQLIKDGDGLSDIVVVQLPLDAKENTENAGVAFPGCRFLGWFSDEQPFNIGADYNLGLFLSPEGRIITNYFQV